MNDVTYLAQVVSECQFWGGPPYESSIAAVRVAIDLAERAFDCISEVRAAG